MKIWSCKIGDTPNDSLPAGADQPMRRAVEKAYKELTGREPRFLFSGWGDELTEDEKQALDSEKCSEPMPGD